MPWQGHWLTNKSVQACLSGDGEFTVFNCRLSFYGRISQRLNRLCDGMGNWLYWHYCCRYVLVDALRRAGVSGLIAIKGIKKGAQLSAFLRTGGESLLKQLHLVSYPSVFQCVIKRFRPANKSAGSKSSTLMVRKRPSSVRFINSASSSLITPNSRPRSANASSWVKLKRSPAALQIFACNGPLNHID